MKKIFTCTLILSSLFFLVGCGEAPWTPLLENREGIEALKAGNPALAMDHFIRALSQSPYRSELHHNLGLSFDQQKKGPDAMASYQAADQNAETPTQKFAARFNLGELYGRDKKIDEALGWYQKALDLDPNSIEAKTNIELLTAQQQGKGGGGQGDQQQQDQKGDQQKKDQDEGDDKQEPKDPKDGDDQKDEEDEKEKEGAPRTNGGGQYKMREFKGDLSENDVKNILNELRQQEQRIRADFNRREPKERPRDKDW